WMLLSSVNSTGDHRLGCLAQKVFFSKSTNLQGDWDPAKAFHHVMIKKRHAALNRVGHLHSVAAKIQNIIWQKRFGPDEEGLIQWIAPIQHGGDIECVQE